ncbi:ABC transporter ATP-binding protein [Radicibacter daui]|uniref:ABC transporter ATP-binding protein n=1 Tax=Radicibacter daui TaxID=3064829 RepID=UPI004046FE0C
MSDALFSLSGTGFRLGEQELLSGINLTFPAGRITALVGHNGSGKSTLLKLLARQQLPTSGTITFAGRPLPEWRPRDFARKVAYLPQTPSIASDTLVEELVAFGRYPWHGALGRFGKADRDRVEEAITLTGIGALRKRPVETLSGGERQRVWLAMLVAQGSECLLLDEPTSALDIAHQIEVMGLIRELCDKRDTGVIIVLHDINMAARFCDRIVALKQGGLIDQGDAATIMTSGRMKSIYGVDMEIISHPKTGLPTALA